MRQVSAQAISNEPILGAFERASAGTVTHPEARNTLGSWIIWLKCPEIAHEAKPGQFVMVRCGEYLLPRPFSIHQASNQGIAILYAVLEGGKGTAWLSQRKKGDTVELFGPLGNGFFISPTSRNLLLVAGGNGIAPLYFLAEETLKKGYSVTLLYGTAIKNPYLEDHLTPGIKLITATEDGSVGKKGKVTDLLPDFTGWADQTFACGPMPMYRDMALKKKELKLEGKSVQVSLEVRMGCGRGVCYGCTLKTRGGLKKVCQNGPIFDLDDILWDELNY